MTNAQTIPLPKGWPKVVRSGVLHAVALASTALSVAWGRAASSRSSRQRRGAEVDRLRAEAALLEAALLKGELGIKDARWARVPARRRPYYNPIQRMQILQLKAARGWSAVQTAERFLVREETIASWMGRLDEEGEGALVQVGEPVNKFPEFVGYLIRNLKLMCPTLGKVRIAQTLARAGLHLGATTVGRMLKRDLSKEDVGAEEPAPTIGRVVTAKSPNHIWHVDLTTVP